jgi:hypothetical protein
MLFWQNFALAQGSFAQPEHPVKVAQFDADDSYDPFADYSEFDSAQEEEEDINFFRNGRFLSIGLLLGLRGFTDTLGSLVSMNANYGLFLTYFFDLRFALQFSFTTGDHSYGFTSASGIPYSGDLGIQDFGFDIKYYVNTQNVTKGLAKFNPYVLVGFSEIFRTQSVPGTAAYGKDSATGFDLGGGIEWPLMHNQMFWGIQAMYQLVTFPGSSTQIATADGLPSGITPNGSTYTVFGTLGINF